MKKNSILKTIGIPILTIMFCMLLSYLLFYKFDIEILFNDQNLITHYGIFLGFGLTIYTFILSILDVIVIRVRRLVKHNERKELIISKIFSGVNHLKQDIIGIFMILLVQLVTDLIQSKNLFINEINVIQQGLFIYSLFILTDICFSLFGISDISITLLNNDNENENEENSI